MSAEQPRFCMGCGTQLAPDVKFCTACGTPAGSAPASPSPSPESPAPAPAPADYPVYTQPGPPQVVQQNVPQGGPVVSASTYTLPTPQPATQRETPATRGTQSGAGTQSGGGTGSASGYFIGPYRLIRELGRGGMGVVFLAVRDDGAFRKNVAIKLLLRDQVNDEFILRFKQERQVLAALDHPNIARILDGGDAPDGMPYYVMEYVEGLPLDEYCDQKRLSVSWRIRTFQQVCRAVEYLHQNSILHRDLKPSNILVSNDGAVKLLDFGIAKVVGAAAAFGNPELTTSAQGRPMTPTYASPEQISGVALQKTSDVYSLGAILYRLLTGRLPYEGVDDKLAKLFTRQDPAPPSANIREDLRAGDTTAKLRKSMTGELDSIVLMSMRFDPKDRYQSAAEFADDLQRYLDGQPVVAHHASAMKRSFRALRRRGALVAAVAILVLLGGAGAWEWRRIESQKTEVASREARLRGLLDQLEARLDAPASNAVPDRAQDVKTLRTAFQTDFPVVAAGTAPKPERDALLGRGVRYLDRVHAASSAPALDSEVATAYQQFGLLQENTMDAKSGDSKSGGRQAAAQTYQKASEVLVSLSAANPDDAKAKEQLAMVNERIVALGGQPAAIPASPAAAPPEETAPAAVVEPVKPAAPPPRQTQIRVEPPPVAPPPRPAPPVAPPQQTVQVPAVAPPPPPPAAPRLSNAVRAELDDKLTSATAKAQMAEQSIEPLRQDLARRGQLLNPDTQSAMLQMRARLAKAKSDIAAGDAAAAQEDLAAAEAFATKVLRAVGR
jgi:predicted Ser/Thr protein kinase